MISAIDSVGTSRYNQLYMSNCQLKINIFINKYQCNVRVLCTIIFGKYYVGKTKSKYSRTSERDYVRYNQDMPTW